MEQLSRYHVSAPNCFTLVRYIFAFCIFCNHLCFTTGNEIFLINGGVFVTGFFIISGFLTFNNYIKAPDVKLFVKKRIRRIVPAYVLAVLFCFLLGLTLTTLPSGDFLANPQTWKYLLANLCFLNYIQPTLPGVFEENVLHAINASLWTMKVEIMFYITVPVVHWLITRFGKNKVLLPVVLLSILYNVITAELYARTQLPLFSSLNHQIFGVLSFFYAPVLILLNSDWIRKYIVPLLSVSLVLHLLSHFDKNFNYVDALPYSLLLLAFVYGVKPLLSTYRWKDYSYEFYLFRFPIMQTVVFCFPQIEVWQLFLASLPISILTAYIVNSLVKTTLKAIDKRKAHVC